MQANFNRKYLLKIISGCLLLTVNAIANAAYTVIDDDLMPTQYVDTQQASAGQPHYTIPFAKEYAALGPMGRAALDALIPQMRNQQIHIVGRADAMPYIHGKLASLATNRANNIRNYLLRAGVSSNAITVETDNTPNPQQNGSIYPSDIYIGRTNSNGPAQAYIAANQPYTPAYIQPAQAPSFAPPSTYSAPQPTQRANTFTPADKIARAQIIQYISRAAQTGQIDPIAALKMIQILSNADMNNTIQTASQIIQIAPAPSPALFVATTNNIVNKQSWQLVTSKTLRDNIDAWAVSVGWNPTQWLATNYYQVTNAVTLTGDFPDILRQIADSTKLNICVFQRSKRIKVTDSSVPCKD